MFPDRIAVIGAGSWGTALAKSLSEKGIRVSLWGHRREHVESIKQERQNRAYLPGIVLNRKVTTTSDLGEAAAGKKFIVMVVPSHVFRAVFLELQSHLETGSYIISAAKGVENRTLMTMTQIMKDVLGPAESGRLGVLSGPSFAKEVAEGIPTAVTVGAETRQVATIFQDVFFTDRFRVYASTDIIGLELGGAIKNIIAIAAGICDGLGYGTNTRAALITRGLAEMARLGIKMGANPLTFSGLGGLGDLVLTCTGNLSRNRMVGLKLGQGKGLSAILNEMNMVAEGIKTTKSVYSLARREGVEMPILQQVYSVIYEDKPCQAAVYDLLDRDQKEEIE